jgi:hypothetical protein
MSKKCDIHEGRMETWKNGKIPCPILPNRSCISGTGSPILILRELFRSDDSAERSETHEGL